MLSSAAESFDQIVLHFVKSGVVRFCYKQFRIINCFLVEVQGSTEFILDPLLVLFFVSLGHVVMLLAFTLLLPKVHMLSEHIIVFHFFLLLFRRHSYVPQFSLFFNQVKEMSLEVFKDLVNMLVILHRPF